MTHPDDAIDEARLRELREHFDFSLQEFGGNSPVADRYERDLLAIIDEVIARRAAEAWIWWKPGDPLPEDGRYVVLVNGVETMRDMLYGLWRGGGGHVKAYLPRKIPPPPPRSET